MSLNLSTLVLVVDDSNTMGLILSTQLRQIGFLNVDLAHGGTTALAKMDKKKYGLVISDWNMDPMTGLDLLKRIRSHGEHAQIPFVMITAQSDKGHVLAAKDAGADNYIVKPFTAPALQAKLESVFANRDDGAIVAVSDRNRRTSRDRRSGVDSRPESEKRLQGERRSGADRRSGRDRRAT